MQRKAQHETMRSSETLSYHFVIYFVLFTSITIPPLFVSDNIFWEMFWMQYIHGGHRQEMEELMRITVITTNSNYV